MFGKEINKMTKKQIIKMVGKEINKKNKSFERYSNLCKENEKILQQLLKMEYEEKVKFERVNTNLKKELDYMNKQFLNENEYAKSTLSKYLQLKEDFNYIRTSKKEALKTLLGINN